MMSMKHIGNRDDYITCTALTAQGADAYDGDGNEITTGGQTTIAFWGDIKDEASSLSNQSGQRRDVRQISISVDSRDVEDLTIDYTLVYAGSADIFQVVDIVETEFRFTSKVIAQYTNI